MWSLSEWFWSPSIWLPPGYDWSDITPYTKFEDLLYPIPLALCLLCLRVIVEKTIFYPLGASLGIKNCSRKTVPPNSVLEDVFQSKAKLTYTDIEALGKRTDLEPRQVERWFRKRMFQDRPTKIAKFSESGCRFICYSLSPLMGLYILWDKPWFYDIRHCWYGYPYHIVTDDVWWYYMLGSAFYWSLMFSQFFDSKRKDYWVMFVHHLSTICLLGFSWTCNLTRIGTLVLVLHDCADASLEIAKMTQYAELRKASDILFPFFAVTWIVTRLGIYPAYILNSTFFELPVLMKTFPAINFLNGMLVLLLFLHIFWTWFIVKAVAKAITTAKVGGDTRSSTDVSDLDISDSITSSSVKETTKSS